MNADSIKIMSRADAVGASRILQRDTVIISIGDRNTEPAAIDFDNNFVRDVLFLSFDDEESVEAGGMTPSDARKVLNFVEKHVSESVDLIVHCGGGVSRSAGTAAAIMLILFGDDSPVFNSPRFSPNMHCYRSVLNAAGLVLSDECIDEKEEHQHRLWFELARRNGLL